MEEGPCSACPRAAACMLVPTSQAAAAANNQLVVAAGSSAAGAAEPGASCGAAAPSTAGAAAAAPSARASALLALSTELLEMILSSCDVEALLAVQQACQALHSWDPASQLRLAEKVAKAAVEAATPGQADRWRRRSWLARLQIEDAAAGFAGFAWGSPESPLPADAAPSYRFLRPTAPDTFAHIKLEGMGPKLLVSDVSTADQPMLRWRLVVRGNTAVEFGVVPLCLEADDKALHKCQQEARKFERIAGSPAGAASLPEELRPTGFCSSITVGSMLPFKTAIMKGSVVELLARRGRLEILVQNPPDGQELYWHNTRTIPKPYKGPREVRFEQDFSPHHDIKLALTSWAHGAFDVLHAAPGSRLAGAGYQQDWTGEARSRHAPQQQRQQQQPAPQGADAGAAVGTSAAAAAGAAAATSSARAAKQQRRQQQQQQTASSPPPGDSGISPSDESSLSLQAMDQA